MSAATFYGPPGAAVGESGSSQHMRPGDWICPACNDLVFGKNDSCRRCGTQKSEAQPQRGHSASSLNGYGSVKSWGDGASYDDFIGSPRGGCGAPRYGDWICSSCGDLQFARNASCRRCGQPRMDGVSANPRAGPPAGMGGFGMGGGDMRPGDWACPNCGDHVFARNSSCRRCGTPRPGEDMRMSQMDGWRVRRRREPQGFIRFVTDV